MRRRAVRRVRWLLIGLALLTVLVVAGAFAVNAGRINEGPRSRLIAMAIMAALLGLTAGALAVGAWAVRRRGVSAVSPLWGVDNATRQRIVRAIKDQQELSGPDRDLALSEAIRCRKLTRLAMTTMMVTAAAALTAIIASLAGDVEPVRLGLYVIQLASVCLLAVHQVIFYRRAGAYLARFGSPPHDGSDCH